MLICQDFTFSYDTKKTFVFPSLVCPSSETLLILGNSGTGKTTFLHLLALLLRPKSGSLLIDDKEMAQLSAKEAAQVRGKYMGIVYQKQHFVSSLSVLDNLLLANYLANNKPQKQQVKRLADELGIEDLLQKKTTTLSGGEQQRVGIARALMNNPRIILADEPTSSLDDENCQKVIQLLENQAKNIGASLIIVTHDQRLKDQFATKIEL